MATGILRPHPLGTALFAAEDPRWPAAVFKGRAPEEIGDFEWVETEHLRTLIDVRNVKAVQRETKAK